MLKQVCHVMLAVGAALGLAPAQSAIQFVTPIGGVAYQDWTIVNYVDQGPYNSIRDWAGGTYTYDGHNGIDYTLPNFAAMDRDIPVYAAAAGTVIEVHDGEFDHCSRVNPCGDNPNYVRIQHADGVVTSYLHLMNGSPTVHVGDTVSAGQTIGNVGSSGLSSDAHLHFEVTQNGQTVETYDDPSAWWVDPLPYAGTQRGALDFGVTDHSPSLQELVDRPIDAGPLGAGDTAWVWVNLFGAKLYDTLFFNYYTPAGDLFAERYYLTNEIHYGWYRTGVDLGSDPLEGKWSVDILDNTIKLATARFQVGTAVPEPATWAMMIGGLGVVGGALRRRRNRPLSDRAAPTLPDAATAY